MNLGLLNWAMAALRKYTIGRYVEVMMVAHRKREGEDTGPAMAGITIVLHHHYFRLSGITIDMPRFLAMAQAMLDADSRKEFRWKPADEEGASDFVVPAWAMPEMQIYCGKASVYILKMFKRLRKARSSVIEAMKEAGVPEAQVAEFEVKAPDPYAQAMEQYTKAGGTMEFKRDGGSVPKNIVGGPSTLQ